MNNLAKQLSILPLTLDELKTLCNKLAYAVRHLTHSDVYVFEDDSSIEIDKYRNTKVNGSYFNV